MTGKSIFMLLLSVLILNGFRGNPENDDLVRGKSILMQIFRLYNAGHDNLFNEYYPLKTDNKVTYLAGNDTVTEARVAYLWPTSGLFSAINAMFGTTGSKQYFRLMEKKILPGLEQYYDSQRKPPGYQSYITKTGKSDRYYDDNIWLAIDFCDLFMLSHKHAYLEKSLDTWQFIISGWDDKLEGGIYWCEQKQQSKNTCSNAPAAVLALKLFKATGDSLFFKWGLRIYGWTKTNLQDSTDHLYFDNKNLSGKVDRRKYTYNSGQMLQASALLYRLTGKEDYLEEAQQIAKSATAYFTEDFKTPEGKNIRLFKNTGNWFNAVLLRGYAELFLIDNKDEFLNIFRDNLDHVWKHVRDKNGLFSKDWKGQKEDENKWLLDQAAVLEMEATLFGYPGPVIGSR